MTELTVQRTEAAVFLRPRMLAIIATLIVLAACTTRLTEPREYSVFFQTNQASLTPDAQQLVARIAGNARDLAPTKIVVAGTADGGTAHDAELADQRALVVLHALVGQGVSAAIISQEFAAPKPVITGVAAHRVIVRFLP